MLNDLTVTELRGVRGPVHVRLWTSAPTHTEPTGAPADMEEATWHFQLSIHSADTLPAMVSNGDKIGRTACLESAKIGAALLEHQWLAAQKAVPDES